MKINFLISCLFLCTSTLSAQKEFIANWGNGTPKTRLILRGIDTLLFEQYRQNGTIIERKWGKDSVYIYDRRGFVLEKRFFNQVATLDSTLLFFPNGVMFSKKYTDVKGVYYDYVYSFEGELKRYKTIQKVKNNLTKTQTYAPKNKLLQTSWAFMDSKARKDTNYHYITNGIHFIETVTADGHASSVYFDWHGQIDTSKEDYQLESCLEAVPNDSIEENKDKQGGIRYKDCTDGFYRISQDGRIGLVDEAKKWILPPRFEAITKYRNNQFGVKINGLYGVIVQNGEWLIPPQYNSVEFTHLPDIFIVGKHPQEKPKFDTIFSTPSNDALETEALICYNCSSRYGLMKTDGTEILPPIFAQIKALNWRSSVFLIETSSRNRQTEHFVDSKTGLFDAYKGLVVDTIYKHFDYENYTDNAYNDYQFDYKNKYYHILENTLTHKAEIFDHLGQRIFNEGMDNIQPQTDAMPAILAICGWGYYRFPNRNVYPDFGYLIVHNKGKAGLFNLDSLKFELPMNRYDSLIPWLFKHEENGYYFTGLLDNHDADAELALLAREKGQWWLLNTKGQRIYPHSFDTVGEITSSYLHIETEQFRGNSIFGIKNGKLTLFNETSYPKTSTLEDSVFFEIEENIKELRTFDYKIIRIDTEGNVIKD